ncbi:MAG: hypothetical protein JWM11_4123, partial [Planctomycetaceae bacterium]|nr:hypothetical protein [Planctomycetaceae bacterium]
IKQVLFNHAEKIVLGTAGLIVLVALVGTTWGGIDKQPEELQDKATKAGQALHTGAWPQEEQAKFTESTYQSVAMNMLAKLADDHGRISPLFAYDKPMSFPLYKRIDPKTEVTWPTVSKMLADSGEMIIAVTPEVPMLDEAAEGEADGAAANPRLPAAAAGPTAKGHSAPKSGGPAANPVSPMGPMGPMGPGMGGDGMMGGVASAAGVKPRGQRYVAVRGIVELDQFHKAIRDALRLDQLNEAQSYLEFMDVKVQRQKAVAGPNPWLDANWEDVDLAKADEVFKECELAPDIVQLELTDPVITMPLPARLDNDYTDIVSHPFIKDFQLTKEQREQQEKIIRALQEEAGGLGGDGGKPKRRGFSGITEDIQGLQRNFMSNNGDMGAIYSKAGLSGAGGAKGMHPPGQPMMGGGQVTLLPPSAGMMSSMGRGKGPGPGPVMPGMAAMPGRQGPGMGQGMVHQAGQAAVGYVLLLRYLDFDVYPGEAYRYRVKLVVANPNFGEQLDKVRNAADAEGETRETEWSEPTAPAVIKTDTNVFLTKVDERTRYRGETEMKVIQWDPLLGTYIDGDIRVKPGQFVSGLGESERLDLATPSLEKKTVLFASKEFLVDSSIPAKLIPSEHQDLKLGFDARADKIATALGAPAEVLVMNEYGEVHMLDTESSKQQMEKILKKVKDERKPWESLKAVAKVENRLDEGPTAMAGTMPMMGTGTSSTKKKKKKRGGKDDMGAMATGPSPVMGPPGVMGGGAMGGAKGKKDSMHAKKK